MIRDDPGAWCPAIELHPINWNINMMTFRWTKYADVLCIDGLYTHYVTFISLVKYSVLLHFLISVRRKTFVDSKGYTGFGILLVNPLDCNFSLTKEKDCNFSIKEVIFAFPFLLYTASFFSALKLDKLKEN